MPTPPDALLIVAKGIVLLDGVATPNAALPLWEEKVILGRASPECQLDFPFISSPFVSRRHATIEYKDVGYVVTDLGSRHGTRINGNRLKPDMPQAIQDGDRISLAKDEVILMFVSAASMGGETWDFAPPEPSPGPPPQPILLLDHDRREVILDGDVLDPPLRGKLYDLLKFLYDNRGRAVSDVEIMKEVWPEAGWVPTACLWSPPRN